MTLRISPSGAELLHFCGVAFERRYVMKDRRWAHTVPQTVGKAVHLAARVDLETKRAKGVTISDDAIPDLAADAFERQWEGEPPDINEDDGYGSTTSSVKGAAKDHAIELELMHHAQIARAVKPKLVECKVEHSLPGYPFDIMGIVDLTEEDDHVRDLKTRARTPRAEDVANSIQASMYPFIIEQETGAKVPRFTLDVLVKTKTPKLVQISAKPGDWSHLYQRFDRMAQVVESGAFLPADPGHWKCSEKFCEYWDDCPFGRARRTAFALDNPW